MSEIERLPDELLVNPTNGDAFVRSVTHRRVGNWLSIIQEAALQKPLLLPPVLDGVWVAFQRNTFVFVQQLAHLNFSCHVTISENGNEVIPTFKEEQNTLQLADLRWTPFPGTVLLLIGVRMGDSAVWQPYLVLLDTAKDGQVYLLPLPNQYNDGKMCMGSGNTGAQAHIGGTEGWRTVCFRILETLRVSEWFSDSLFQGSWKEKCAPALFRWMNVEGFPQVAPAGNWKEKVRPLSIPLFNDVLAQLTKHLVPAEPVKVETPVEQPATPEPEVNEDDLFGEEDDEDAEE